MLLMVSGDISSELGNCLTLFVTVQIPLETIESRISGWENPRWMDDMKH